MKWVIIGLLLAGGIILTIGVKESNNLNQSPDVRVGGSIISAIGTCFIILALIIMFVVLLIKI